MLRSFVAWLAGDLAGEGTPVVVRTVLGLLGFAALLGVAVDGVAVRAGVIGVVLLLLLGLVLLLLADRRSLHSQLDTHKRLVSRYSTIIDKLKPTYQVIAWNQQALIGPGGDTAEVITVRARVLTCDLQVIRLGFGCGWDQPAQFRRKVRLSVRNTLVGGVPGTSLDRTCTWVRDGVLSVIIHFSTPPRLGTEISFTIEWKWPGKSRPLIDGKPDDFTLAFVQPVQYARYEIALPPGQYAYYEPVGFHQRDDGFRTEAIRNGDGQERYLFEAVDLPADHKAGIRLELKRKGARSLRPNHH